MYPKPCYGRVDLCEEILASMGVFGLRVDNICAMESRSNAEYVHQNLMIAYCSFGEVSWKLEAWSRVK